MVWYCTKSKKAAIEYWYPNEPVNRFVSNYPPVGASCIPLHQRMEIFGFVSYLQTSGNPAYDCDTVTRVTHGGDYLTFWNSTRFVWSPVEVAFDTDNRSVYCTDRAKQYKESTVIGPTQILVKCHGRADLPLEQPPTKDPVIIQLYNTGERSPILGWNLTFAAQRNYVHPTQLPSIFQLWDRRGVIFKRISYSQGCPNWRIICQGICPPGTCEVKCGKSVCCYNDQGDAVYMYKPL